jgi:hypothetical protein
LRFVSGDEMGPSVLEYNMAILFLGDINFVPILVGRGVIDERAMYGYRSCSTQTSQRFQSFIIGAIINYYYYYYVNCVIIIILL